MKKLINLVALVIMLSVNVLTPVTYAQIEIEDNFSDYDKQEVTLVVDANNPGLNVSISVNEWISNYMLYSRRYVSDGVEFAEWYDNENLEGEPFDVMNMSKNMPVILYAKWIQKITYQPGLIKVSNGDKTILVKDVNQGGNQNRVDKYQKVMRLKNDAEYCHEEKECYGEQRSCHNIFVCSPDFFSEVSNILGTGVNNLEEIDEYFTSLYGRYYFWGNNGYAEYDKLIHLQYGEIDVGVEAKTRGFLNYSKFQNPDMGRKINQKSQNPCDITKGEYMPTLNDWAELMYMWADINREDISVYDPNEGAGRGGASKRGGIDVNKHIKLLNSKLFQQDILMPNAGFIGSYQNKLNYSNNPSALLWMAMDNERRYGSYNVEFGELTPSAGEGMAVGVRCFLIEDPVTVEFEGSNVEPYKVQEGTTIIPPVNPTKDGYTFEGWYKNKELTQKWDFDRDIVEGEKVILYAKWRACGNGFVVSGNKCIPKDIDMSGIIEVSDGRDVFYIKDKNVGAKAECPYELSELSSIEICDKVEGSAERGLKFGSCMEEVDFFEQVNAMIDDAIISTMEEFNTYVEQRWRNCKGNYYFRGNNSGASYNDFEFTDVNNPGKITNTGVLLLNGFNGGRMGMLEGEGWIKGNSQDNPCSGNGEYLPTTEDWENLLRVWMNKNGNNPGTSVAPEDSGMQTRGTSAKDSSMPLSGWMMQKFMLDMKIPGAGIVNYRCIQKEEQGLVNRSAVCEDELFYNGKSFGLRTVQQGDNVGMLDDSGMLSKTVQDSIADGGNDIAASVRCFVDINMPEVLVVTLISEGQRTREVNVVSGEKLGKPSVDGRNGYTFEGWYTKGGTEYNFGTPVTEDIILYAKWTENKGGGQNSGGGGGSSNKIDKSDTSVNEKNINSTDIKDIQGDTKVSPSVSQGDNNKQASLSRDAVQVNDSVKNGNTEGDRFTSDFKNAYNYAKQNGITTKSSIENANMYGNLTRIQMAKMLSQYAINVMGREPDISKGIVKFNDVTNKMDRQYDNAVTLAYQLGIMGINMPNNNFRPNDEVTRAEFVTALSRLLYGTSDGNYESTYKYYTNHMKKLESEEILTNTNPKIIERRGYVMIMLMRSSNWSL